MTARFSLLAVLACLIAAPARADEFDDALKGLEKAVKEKSKVDVVHYATVLGDKFKDATDAQKKLFFPAMKKAVTNPDKDAKKAVVEALGKAADARGLEVLTAEIDKTKDDVQYQGWCIESIGRIKDLKTGAPYLKKLFNHKSIEVVAAAVRAYAFYKDVDLAARKEIVNDLLKMYGSYSSAANNPRDNSGKNKLEKTQTAFEETLKALTGLTDKSGHDQWSKWWNDTGKKADKW
jgi:HEAT repeat protein